VLIAVEDASAVPAGGEKGDHLRPDAILDSPFAPLLEINLELKVYESVAQGRWHSVSGRAI